MTFLSHWFIHSSPLFNEEQLRRDKWHCLLVTTVEEIGGNVQHEGNVAVRLRVDLYTLLHKIFIYEYNCSHKYGVIPGELPRRERLHTFCIANVRHYKEVARASHFWICHRKTVERICRSLMIIWVSQFLIKSGKCRHVWRLSHEEWYGRIDGTYFQETATTLRKTPVCTDLKWDVTFVPFLKVINVRLWGSKKECWEWNFMVAGTPCQRELGTFGWRRSEKGEKNKWSAPALGAGRWSWDQALGTWRY